MLFVKTIAILNVVALSSFVFAFPHDEGSHEHGLQGDFGLFPRGPPFHNPLERGNHKHHGHGFHGHGPHGHGPHGHGPHGHGPHGHGPHGHGPHGLGPHGHGHPPPPFVRNANEQARREYFSIQMNPDSTKAETNQKLEQWAENNGVKDQYDNFTTTLKNFAQKYHDLAIANLAGEALQLYNKLWEIRQNEQISGLEECTQIKNILNSTSPDLDFVIISFLPSPINKVKCDDFKHKPHHGHPPFGKSSSFEDGLMHKLHHGHGRPTFASSEENGPKGPIKDDHPSGEPQEKVMMDMKSTSTVTKAEKPDPLFKL